ncbi:MAG: hypothetical protein IPL24_01785 [Bacteroidetes bacterium]|nr:hypothetical protein [Bacteroidota bacterium]
MQDNILNFSNEEMQVLVDKKFFELKHSSTAKMIELFGMLEVELKSVFSEAALNVEGLNSSSGKIFRGENYKLFPYVLLDCPRMFNKQSVFAFRSMFWWGNEFTFTLHIQGNAWEYFKPKLIRNLERLTESDIYFCVNESPWQYHLGTDNYLLLNSQKNLELALQILSAKDFVKLTRKLSISEYKSVIQVGKETLKLFLGLLKD